MEDTGTILIVDDSPDNLNVLMGLLGKAGYRVRPALSGEIALRAVEARPPDLILLDVRMPGMDGYETCKRLQANKLSRDIPVIFISAMQDTEDKLAGFRAGGVDYIAKPFQAEEVLARVRTHVELYHMKQHLEGLVQKRTTELALSEARYRVLFEDSPLAVMVYDPEDWCILEVNVACARLLGYSVREMLGNLPGFALEPGQRGSLRTLAHSLTAHSEGSAYTGPLRFVHKDGHIVETEGVVQRIDYQGCRAQILMLQDVTESRLTEERLQRVTKEHSLQLEKSTYYDALTGLPNRMLLTQRMHQGIAQVQRTGNPMVVCFLDVDNFKPLNEHHGQEVGDRLLVSLAKRLRDGLREGDTLARVGGDEFVFLLMGLQSNEKTDARIKELQQRLTDPITLDALTFALTASIGVTIYPQDDADPDTLLRHADQAMLLTKQNNKGGFCRFDSAGDKRERGRQEAIEQMRGALVRREFVLYYQPKVDLKTNAVIGAEALIRWRHPELGLLTPGAFLPEAEGDDFMIELGEWVIGEALQQMERWRTQALDLTVSVNVAAQHLTRSDFMQRLSAQMESHPALAGRLELEVLETSALDDMGKIEQLISSCRSLGVGFSLDDFGTGYSSLTYLRRLSADTLKIDQSFICSMLDNPGDQAIVAGVIGLAQAFGRKVIAEGVETVGHGKILLGMGCSLVQGYGVARPMPAEDLPGWVKSWPSLAWQTLGSQRVNTLI